MDNPKNMIVLLYFGLACIVLGVISCLAGNVTGGGVVVTTGLALIILSQFQLESIKMPGLEAKLRSTINDAETVLEKLKNISLPISEIALNTAANSGRVGSATPSKKMMEYVAIIEKQLKGMGFDEEKIITIKQPWIKTASYDLSTLLQHKFIDYYSFLSDKEIELLSSIDIDSEDDEVKRSEIIQKTRLMEEEKQAAKKILSLDDVFNYVGKLYSFIENSKALNESQKKSFIENNIEAIRDINHLLDTGHIRRPNHPDSFPIKD